jgi:phage virion morphogenesis protein
MKEILTTFDRVASSLTKKQAKLRVIGQYISEVSKQSFRKQSDPKTGSPWAALASSTRRQKARLGLSPKALIRTGQLKNSIGFSITRDTVFIGPADKKGIWHQEGTVSGGAAGARSGGGRVHIPARPFIGLSKKDEREIESIVHSWIVMQRK